MAERDLSRINEKYQGMLTTMFQNNTVTGTHSPTEAEIKEMDLAEQWALRKTEQDYLSGGNQGDWDPSWHQDSPAELERQGQS
ncbi:MAG: hypothetical protein ACM3XM_09520 [Mycobacterium leprae]